jgi:hypothetical protein
VLLARVATVVCLMVAIFATLSWGFGGEDGLWDVDRACQDNALGCNAAVETLGTVAALAVAFVWFTSWRVRRVVRPHLDDAAKEPWRLVPTASSVEEVVGRRGLCEIIEKDLAQQHARPQIVVGGVGDGKTAVLVRLAQLLYEHGAVPVAIALRDARTEEDLDFSELAREQFIQRVGASILSEDEGDKVWRELCSERLVVVLADGLEEALPGLEHEERAKLVQYALDKASDIDLPLVITSRPQPILEELDAAIIRLEPLPAHRVTTYIEEAAGGATDGVEEVVRTAEVMERPLYLKLARAVHQAGELPSISCESRIECRVALLDAWRELLLNGKLESEVSMRPQDRAGALATVEQLACVALAENALEVRFDVATRSPYTDFDEARVREARRLAGQARRLDIVEWIPAGVRFRHSILEAYLGARRLPDVVDGGRSSNGSEGGDYVSQALANPGRELTMALVMFCLLDRDPDRAAELREMLCERALGADRHTAFELLAAGYEIQSLADPSDSGSLAKTAGELWRRELPLGIDVETTEAKLRTILPIAELGAQPASRAYETLWEICLLEDEYAVRFQAAQALASGGNAALAVLRDAIGEAAEDASGPLAYRDGRAPDMSSADVRRHSVLGWVMPLLAATCDAAGMRHVRATIEAWVDTACGDASGGTPQLHLGVEAALAQGFKWEANRLPSDDLRESRDFLVDQALRLLDGSTWWYTRMGLVHALALWALDANEPRRREIIRRIAGQRRPANHPFVRETARLCNEAIPRAPALPSAPAVREATKLRGPSRFIWIDEAGVAGKIGPTVLPSDPITRLWIPPAAGWSVLKPEAQQLVAETLVYLNLIEGGDDAAAGASTVEERTERTTWREARRARGHAEGRRLPVCLADGDCRGFLGVRRSHDQPGSASSCAEGCAFELCPYPSKHLPPYRGELNETFCRAQVRLVRGSGRRVPPWVDRVARYVSFRRSSFEQLERFWQDMGRRVRL